MVFIARAAAPMFPGWLGRTSTMRTRERIGVMETLCGTTCSSNKLDDRYPLGFAALDNDRVCHAYHEGANKMRFARQLP